jgi:hypothetical protein
LYFLGHKDRGLRPPVFLFLGEWLANILLMAFINSDCLSFANEKFVS